jgi:Zn-dependent protease with chaperone function
MTTDPLHTEGKYQPCPKCHTSLPVYTGYKTWCDQCGWNLDIPAPPDRQSLFEKLYAARSKKSSQRLFEEMMKGRSLKAVFTPSRLLAFLIACCVHAVTLAFIALGVWLCLFALPSQRILGWFLGVACLFMVWLWFLPRPHKNPTNLIQREQAPMLYQVTRRIAEALGKPPIDDIYWNVTYNASFGQYGWRRKRSLILGLPLLSVLNEEELVALLSHELAHSANDDPNRGFLLGTALYSLASWYQLIHPIYRMRTNDRTPTTMHMSTFTSIFLPIAGLIWVVGYVLSQLLWYDIQRAEYLADWLAAQVSGTNAQFAALDKAQLGETFRNTLKFAYLNRRMGTFFADLKRQIAQVPSR